MRIGFFGDSYAVDMQPNTWQTILCEKFGTTVDQCVNMAAGASPLYYSYKNIIDNRQPLDLIIVTVPTDFRYPKRIFLDSLNQHRWLPNINSLENIQKLCDDQDAEKLERMKNWFIYNPDDFAADMHELMLQKLESIPNLYLFPSFEISFKEERHWPLPQPFSLSHLTAIDRLSHGIPQKETHLYDENMNVRNHFSDEMHPYVANLIYGWIKHKVWRLPDQIVTQKPKEYYWTKRHE